MTTITIEKPNPTKEYKLPPKSWLWSHSKDVKIFKEDTSLKRNAMLINVMNWRPRV